MRLLLFQIISTPLFGNGVEEDEDEVCVSRRNIKAVCLCKAPVVECSRKRGSRWHLSVHGI